MYRHSGYDRLLRSMHEMVNALYKCGRVGCPLPNATDALQRGIVQLKVNKGSRKPSIIVRGHLWLHPEGIILKPRTKLELNRTVVELQRLLNALQ